MKILVLDDDYNLVGEMWADKDDIKIDQDIKQIPANYYGICTKMITVDATYTLKVKLKKAPHGTHIYTQYDPAKKI